MVEELLGVNLGRYRHFKSNFYEVIDVARHSETEEEHVVYQALCEHPKFGKDSLWIRSKSMFLEILERDGKVMPRFEYIGIKDNLNNPVFKLHRQHLCL